MADSAACHRFIQNAWKKELCTNCFKSKEEHVKLQSKPASNWNSTLIKSTVNEIQPQSILKKSLRKNGNQTVTFIPEEFEVIGYGGDEYSSDEDDCLYESNDDPEEWFPDGEEEKELQKLTKINTDFNSVSANLSDKVKKVHAPLELGKPLTDGEGKKQTLLVSVEPFACTTPPKRKLIIKPITNNSEDKKQQPLDSFTNSIASSRNNSEDKKQQPLDSFTNSIASSRKNHLIKLLDCDSMPNNPPSKTFSVAENNLTNLILNQTLSKKEPERPIYSSNVEVKTENIVQEPMETQSSPHSFTENSKKENTEVPETADSQSEIVKVIFDDKFDSVTLIKDEPQPKEIVLHPIILNGTPEDQSENSQNTSISSLKNNLRISLEESSKDSEQPVKQVNRKTQITRGTILTKVHEPIRTKKFLHLSAVDITDTSAFVEKTDKNSPKDEKNLSNSENNIFDSLLSKNMKNLTNGSCDISIKDNFKREVSVEESFPEEKFREPIQLPFIINSSYNKLSSENFHGKSVTVDNRTAENVKNSGKPEDFNQSSLELESRELAGEPDGRADSDESSEAATSPYVSISPSSPYISIPPASPTSPVSSTSPVTPVSPTSLTSPPANPRSSFLHGFKEKPKVAVRPTSFSLQLNTEPLAALCKQLATEQSLSQSLDYLSSESSLKMKRQAPQPPPTPVTEAKMEHEVEQVEKPVVSTPKLKKSHSEPETKRVSMSYDNLNLEKTVQSPVVEKTRKINGAATKMRFTLKKFLRFSSKDEDKASDDAPPIIAFPKPRPEIIHPIDLNKSAVEVLRGDKNANKKTNSVSLTDLQSPKKNGNSNSGRPSKPPPPPRNLNTTVKPARPPPPEANGNVFSVYANIGEQRQNIAPTKPQRTASMKRENHNSDYEAVQNKKYSWHEKENIYEPITVANGTFDTRLNNNRVKTFEQESKQTETSEEVLKNNSPRTFMKQNSVHSDNSTKPDPYLVTSNETDNDVYYPYCFYSMDENNEDDNKKNKLRLRKGRSVVHKSLEDNYGAVVIANHEALAQVLDQLHLNPVIPPHFRGLSTLNNVQWNSFSNVNIAGRVLLADRLFYPAEWNLHPVTLCISPLQHTPCTLPQLYTLSPIIEFKDYVPAEFLTTNKIQNSEQVNISVLSSQFFDSLTNYCATKPASQTEKDIGLIVVQLVNVLKCLQACDLEEISLQELVLCREEKETVPRLCVAPVCTESPLLKEEGQKRVSLCQALVVGTEVLLPTSPLSTVLKLVLKDEHASSLSHAKALVEFWLWGPSETSLSEDRQVALQRWLDLERATVLHGLVCSRNPQISLMEYCHLMFLVRTNAKIMADSSFLLDSYKN